MGPSRKTTRVYNVLAITFTVLVLLGFSVHVSEQGSLFGGSGSSAPLYGPGDEVVVLNFTSLKEHIYGSQRAWVVEFFSSWCGHCINFAPKWKQFAIDLVGWKNIVAIAAIDCADDNNVAVCREYEIMGYPTLRFFPEGTKEMITNPEEAVSTVKILNRGEDMEKAVAMSEVKRILIDTLTKHLPNVLQSPPLTGDMNEDRLWDYIKKSSAVWSPSLLLVVFESESSYVGKEVALSLSKYPSVRVVRFHKKNAIYERLGLDGWPAAGYLKTDKTSGSILLENNQDLSNLLVKSVISLGDLPLDVPFVPSKRPPRQKIQVGGLEEQSNNLEEPNTDNANIISMEDLIHAVRNSLRNEVGLFKQISGTKLEALKKYIHTLTQFFPTDRRELMLFLMKLNSWLLPMEQLDDRTYLDKLTELELELNPWDIDVSTWGSCRGSVPGRRGYTCSLWNLFHTLTVIAHQKNQAFPVLDSIHSFVKEFFGCTHCSSHFTKMVADDGALMINPIRDQVIWLWKAHNVVNLRLKGDLTEDPAYPKILYPSPKQCAECYAKDEKFDEEKVVELLVKVYSKPERTLQPVNQTPAHLQSVNAERSDSDHKKNSSPGFFTGSDYWVFCIVYFSVAAVLVLGYVHFRARRSRIDTSLLCKRLLHNQSGKGNV